MYEHLLRLCITMGVYCRSEVRAMQYDTVLVAGGLITHHRPNEALKKEKRSVGKFYDY